MDYSNNIVRTNTVRARKRTRIRRTNIVTARLRPMQDHFDFTPYEGQLIRVDRDKVYYVKNGQGQYVSKLPTTIDGKNLDWGNVIEVGNQQRTSGLVGKLNQLSSWVDSKVLGDKKPLEKLGVDTRSLLDKDRAGDIGKSVVNAIAAPIAGLVGKPLISADKFSNPNAGKASSLVTKLGPAVAAGAAITAASLPKVSSVNAGGTPVKADVVTTAVTNTPTNSSLADTVIQKASEVSPQLKEQVINQGKELVSDKLGGWLTDAAMLPKTKSLKDAETYIDNNPSSLYSGTQPLQSSVSMFGTTTILMVVGAIVLLIVFSKFNA